MLGRRIYDRRLICLLFPYIMRDSHNSKHPSKWIKEKLDACSLPMHYAIDIAAGSGRHSFLLLDYAITVKAVDRDQTLSDNYCDTSVNFDCLDLEQKIWSLDGEKFDVVVVSNYLYRPHLGNLINLVGPAGYIIYETFGVGNEAYGRPSNPMFLMRENELIDYVSEDFIVLDKFFGKEQNPVPAVKARLFAQRVSDL